MKTSIRHQHKFSELEQNLIFKGQELENNQLISNYNIQDGDTLSLKSIDGIWLYQMSYKIIF